MKKYPLAEEEIHVLLDTEPVGRLASMGGMAFHTSRPCILFFFRGRYLFTVWPWEKS